MKFLYSSTNTKALFFMNHCTKITCLAWTLKTCSSTFFIWMKMLIWSSKYSDSTLNTDCPFWFWLPEESWSIKSTSFYFMYVASKPPEPSWVGLSFDETYFHCSNFEFLLSSRSCLLQRSQDASIHYQCSSRWPCSLSIMSLHSCCVKKWIKWLGKKAKVNFKTHDSTDWMTNNYTTHIVQYLKK